MLGKMGGVGASRRGWSLRVAIRKTLRWAGAVLILLAVVSAAENNVFGYAWRSLQLSFGGAAHGGMGQSPATVMSKAVANGDGSITILAVGDIVSCPEPSGIKKKFSTLASWIGMTDPLDRSKVAAVQTAELAQNWPSAPILALGDIVYQRGTPHEFADCFKPIWGALSPRTLPTPGNHEYYTLGAYPYFDYWGRQAGPERRGYYQVTSGSWLILSLNSEIDAGPGTAQGEWLKDALAASTARCTMAFYHRPAFSLRARKGGGSERQLFDQLSVAGVDIVLNGHNHFYERTYPMDGQGNVVDVGGTVSFVVGTGGRHPQKQVALADFTAAAIFGKQGVLRLNLGDNGYFWAFHDAATNDVLDEGDRGCAAV